MWWERSHVAFTCIGSVHMLRHQQWGKGSQNDEKRCLFLINSIRWRWRAEESGEIIGNCDEVICECSLNCRFFCQGLGKIFTVLSWRLWFSGLDILPGKMNVSNQQTVKSERVKPLTGSLTVLRQRGLAGISISTWRNIVYFSVIFQKIIGCDNFECFLATAAILA